MISATISTLGLIGHGIVLEEMRPLLGIPEQNLQQALQAILLENRHRNDLVKFIGIRYFGDLFEHLLGCVQQVDLVEDRHGRHTPERADEGLFRLVERAVGLGDKDDQIHIRHRVGDLTVHVIAQLGAGLVYTRCI